jgi:hypothetical protein
MLLSSTSGKDARERISSEGIILSTSLYATHCAFFQPSATESYESSIPALARLTRITNTPRFGISCLIDPMIATKWAFLNRERRNRSYSCRRGGSYDHWLHGALRAFLRRPREYVSYDETFTLALGAFMWNYSCCYSAHHTIELPASRSKSFLFC